ncbi:carboxylesterase/lipase family protein [Nocardia terpenica]|nr:carboxylesterase/lipase family protein [Nocardia terpenica]MBF6108936.1 carboxylesterase/lipase family protein [Nocardia terpenica]MBF6121779.1 carboxylesterase/lipase family protein [Nocardia terpenica]
MDREESGPPRGCRIGGVTVLDSSVVRTTYGTLRGSAGNGIAAFLGIPYAAPPFGANRFRGPRPPARWDGVRDALAYGPTAPKPATVAPFDRFMPDPHIPGRDCLNLNVWTPDPGGAGLPVMVWIHGGAFYYGTGASAVYDGAAFARDGVVCVTINYRLGVEGFAHLPDAPANRGLRDQIAALEWVRDNITAFGGDPGNITIFGESAGGISVLTLLARELDLFERAIVQSGSGAVAHDPHDAALITTEIARRLGIEPTAAGFAALEPATIIPVQVALNREIIYSPDPQRWGATTVASGMTLIPVLDDDMLPCPPEDAIAAGAGRSVDLLIGYNTDEFRLFTIATGLSESLTPEFMTATTVARGFSRDTAAAYTRPHPQRSTADRFAEFLTDGVYRIPANRIAEGHTGTRWMYEFAWRSPIERLGACHLLELGFVFDNLAATTGITGDNAPQPLADAMHRAWVDFATHGDPGWQRFDPATRPVKLFDSAGNPTVNDPHDNDRRLWN